MNIRSALAALRRTGFIVLVVAGSVAKAQAALSFEAPQAYGNVDPSVLLLERLGNLDQLGSFEHAGPAPVPVRPGEVRSEPHRSNQTGAWAVAARDNDMRDRQRARFGRDAVVRVARHAAGARRGALVLRRQGRGATPRRKSRRAGRLSRRAARRRRGVESPARPSGRHLPGPGAYTPATPQQRGEAFRFDGTPTAFAAAALLSADPPTHDTVTDRAAWYGSGIPVFVGNSHLCSNFFPLSKETP